MTYNVEINQLFVLLRYIKSLVLFFLFSFKKQTNQVLTNNTLPCLYDITVWVELLAKEKFSFFILNIEYQILARHNVREF